ncbi:gp406 [Bacillus phage G]|uniref:Gp406 n=1 Tax=Bacillus phage G TaxID=2884420 RepID=G3MAE7_9CAUD|nr:gp406 [Bacillus phage G]AEO93664.1 gp406 [Bacillus phage G]
MNCKGLFYCNNKSFSKDINKAKDFTSYATAKKIAQKYNGDAREIYYKK